MAALVYDSVDFATTLGGLPRITRDIIREVEAQSGKVMRELHVITCEWHGVPAVGLSLDASQAAITAIEAAVEALDDNAILYFSENDGGIAWAYDDATKANNHQTAYGVKLTRKNFPWGPGKHVTNAPIVITFEAVIIPCSNDPVTGVGTLSYTISEEWDYSGLVSVTYQGTVCACDGYDVDDIATTLRDTVFTPDARDRFTLAGAVLGPNFGPSSQGYTVLDTGSVCKQFRFVYGGGSPPQGLESTKLELNVQVTLVGNLVTITITATYGYRGDYIGTGSPTGTLFGLGSGSGSIFTSGGFFGLSTAGGTSFDAVYREAWNFAGVDARPFLIPGSGSIFLVTDPEMSVDTASNTISAKKVFFANWIHDATILLFEESVQIDYTQPGFSSRRCMYPNGSGVTPLAYVQTSGYDVYIVRFSATIVSKFKYMELPDRLTPDQNNIWRIEPDTMGGVSQLPDQLNNPGNIQEGYVTSTVTQTYAVRDPSTVAALKGIAVGSVKRLSTAAYAAQRPIDSGGRLMGFA